MSTDLESLLADLHLAITEQLLERVKTGVATASELNVARQMLKDNNIELRPNATSPLGKLADALPDAFDVDDQYPRH
ncbi:hypothetical protein [Marinobacter similis]|uniref:Uncharacterized protein n=1 Tax=Marinobacter similis TaxID=1420916 RepID=W5YKW2_9GAMM|nr:hypothetical protein [Marinobacter similis]AHI29716.1 hypothetical protein AU14_17610 [Marinobacter similis]